MGIETARHSLTHIMASVVLDMFPDAKLGIGPAIENGFYYDFDLPRTLVPEDLKRIEKAMRKRIRGDFVFEKRKEAKAQALDYLDSADQPYKVELAMELEGNTVSFYDTRNDKKESVAFSDMCAGPHVESTKELRSVGFRLDKISGAYFRGDEKRPMLQRIFGLAFETQAELDAYIRQRIEAEKRDHRKLGKMLDLFVFSEKVGAGLPLYTPKGTLVIEELRKRVEKICRQYGFQNVMTPHLAKIELYETSGHAEKFAEELFHVTSSREHDYVMKPVQCPHQTQIYASRPRSYRDLPIRYMESEKQYRAEKTGEIGGLTRVYAITVEDGHSFCRIDQVKQEAMNMVRIIRDFYSDLGMWGNHWVSLSVRDHDHPQKYIGEPGDWDTCEQMLAEISDEMDLDAKRCEGEAALYGPKLDFMFKDAMGREIQIPTVQLDFATPKRFDLSYINKEGKPVPPVMVHRAILGSYERFLALLIEHFAGAFPVWLAPVQVKLLPISDRHHEYARSVAGQLHSADVRVEVDDRSESVGKKIREAELQKIPYMLVIGDKEAGNKNVSVRTYQDGDVGQLVVTELIQRLGLAPVI